jgi:dihydrofolate reductase
VSRLRVCNFGLSLDGFGAGTSQDLQHPLGVHGPEIMEWFFPTLTFRSMHGLEGGETGIDDSLAREGLTGFGAWILGRNMFGPVRGPWPDDSWKGWWGDEPPYHVPSFVLTHHPRPVLPMAGGTDFHFVTGGIHEALDRARAVAGGRDIRVGGGVSTVRQYLEARLLDDLHIALRPVLIGSGESLFAGLDLRALGYTCTRTVTGERATHLFIEKVPG